jgi:tRNA A-37 threonylcarbamoyl transferase component Bud32
MPAFCFYYKNLAMNQASSSFDLSLQAWLTQHATAGSGVWVTEIDGVHCVVKRRRETFATRLIYVVRFIRSWTLSQFCWLAFGEHPAASVLLRNSLCDEAKRLKILHRAGCHVPDILYEEPEVLVLEYVGQGMPFLVRRSTPAERLIWMDRCATDLAHFHQAGFVHGGAQLRNLMYLNNRITRVDFEENIGEAMSRPLGQAYDVYQMLSSMAGLRGHELTPHARQILCDRLLSAYIEANPDPLITKELARMGRSFGKIKTCLGWLLRTLRWRDVQGFLYVTQTLQRL